MEFVTIESHFGLTIPDGASENHSILAKTRNRCAQDLVEMFHEIAGILYPGEEFEIYFLPSEPGGFRDILKYVKKNSGKFATVAVAGTLIAFLSYRDSHETHEHDKKMWIIEDVKKCLELEQQKAELDQKFDITNFPEDKIDEICQNLNLQRKKNDRYQVLKDDSNITNEETILKNDSGQIVISKTINRGDFADYIKPIETEEAIVNLEVSGIIELLGPIVRQRKEGAGIQWKGIYHGEDIFHHGIQVIIDGDSVDFYMQDKEFKEKISNKDIVFKNGDNMTVNMIITFYLSDITLSRKRIYVGKVMNFNEIIIEHKIKIKNKFEPEIENQLSLL